MSQLADVFQNNKAFIPFVVAGDPDADTTVNAVVEMAQAGADIVELGIPFSDPVADGPVIQAGDLRAFAGGITVTGVFDIVARIRKQTTVPLVFLTYANIPFKYGYDAFCQRCAALGVYGLVIPDLPLEAQDEIRPSAAKYGVDLIELIALTSGDRIPQLAAQAEGFIYVVSSEGVTGEREAFDTRLSELVQTIRQYTTVPTAIGFGIHTPAQAHEMAAIADGVIIGSAIVDQVAQLGGQAPAAIGDYTRAIKQAVVSAAV